MAKTPVATSGRGTRPDKRGLLVPRSCPKTTIHSMADYDPDPRRQTLETRSPACTTLPLSPHNSPTLEIDAHGIGWIVFDDSERKLNVLTEGVMRRLAMRLEEVDRLVTTEQLHAVVVASGKARSFVAGADVEQIAAIRDSDEGEAAARLGQAIFLDLERVPVPTIAAIDGICLGGGTELSLACQYRIASDSPKTRIGLPEVQLGIIPAWGGTTRLPRLVGLGAALPILLTGKPVSAREARRIGLVDDVMPSQDFRDRVRDFTRAVMHGTAPRRRTPAWRGLVDNTVLGRRLVLTAARRRVQRDTGGNYPAPHALIDVLSKSLGAPVEDALAVEAAQAGELIASSVSKNLIHVFHLRERARKDTGAAPCTIPRTVDHVVVLGAGVMGGAIAQLLAYKGIRARMKDVNHDAIAGGLRHARRLFDDAVERHKLLLREAQQCMELVSGGIEYQGIAEADLVIEAIVERMETKRTVLREVEERSRPDCVLATNTSSLSVDAIAEVLQRPDRFCGMHFFNPVHRMPLVEVVRGTCSSDETVASVYRLALNLGKVPVVVRDGPGFVVNRILAPYLNEAGWLLADGVTVERIDAAARAFGMPMGPARLLDEVGLDVAHYAANTLHQAFGDRLFPAPPLRELETTDRLGRKNTRGFYRYENGRAVGVDRTVYDDLGLASAEHDGPDDDEIRMRLILSMVNEAVRTLGDRVVDRAGELDLATIMGTGFPPFTGGPLRFADSMGIETIVAYLEDLTQRAGPRFEPAPLLVELAVKGRRLYHAFGRG